MRTTGATGPIQGGNATTLTFDGDRVRASSDYELFDDQVMDVDSFVEVLTTWRDEVLRVLELETPAIPETYRRNPYPA